METEIQDQEQEWQKCREEWQKSHRRGKIFGGIILVTIGSLLLAKHMGVEFPEWLFTWKVLLIVIGLFIGVKHSFRRMGWLIPVAIGSAFLLEGFYPEMNMHNFWPVFIILAGVIMIFKPHRSRADRWKRWEHKYKHKWDRHYGVNAGTSTEDRMESSAVFGSIKKNIIAKDFKGGEVNCVFGGAVINLTQADIENKATLEINVVFGGVKLYVPQHWFVQSNELVTVMGGIDDKRPPQTIPVNHDKILILRGSAVFGGIEILN